MGKLVYKVGCFIKAIKTNEVDAAGQQCNCYNRMRSGIAPLLAKEWSSIRTADDAWKDLSPEDKLGKFSYTKVNEVSFFNLYGQLHWKEYPVEEGRNTDYIALTEALHRMERRLGKPCRVGFPLIGCGLAGGEWRVVSKLIHDVFITKGYEVTIYVLSEGIKVRCEDE